MGILPVQKIFSSLFLLCAAVCLLQPVLAETGSITIAYRGSGGGYIGDTVVFDGRNTFGNTTLIRISGPGLPAEGVPANNLNGAPGTATAVSGDQYGTWKFVWYASVVPGIEKLQTAKYTFTASDFLDPGKYATASFMLKKPEYSIKASPDPVTQGKYVELVGFSEQDISSADIEISDKSGKVMRTFSSPVSSSGYFSYGFHADMEPGLYKVTVRNPVLRVPFGTTLSVISGEETLQTATTAATPSTTGIPVITTVATTEPVPSPTRSPAAPGTVIIALFAGAGVVWLLQRS